MKKITLSALAALTIALSITSCKKGEEDPGFSVISRKARVAGTWKISSYEETSSSTIIPYSNITTSSVAGTAYLVSNTTSHDGTILTMSSTSPGAGNASVTTTSTGTVSEHSYVFEKNGTWSSVRKSTVSSNETKADFYGNTYSEATTTTSEITSSGTWDFLNGVGDEFKSKERLSVATASEDLITTTQVVITPITSSLISASSSQTVSTSNYTYDSNKKAAIWNLTQLRNKEMKVVSEFESSSKGGSVYTSSTFNDENKNNDVTTTGTSSMIFTSSK